MDAIKRRDQGETLGVPVGHEITPILYPKVILYGDSITQQSFSEHGRWGALLADQLQRKCDVLNRGFSGYTSRWNRLMLPRFFHSEDAPNIAAVTLFLGANDSNKPSSMQHVPLEEYTANMRAMLHHLIGLGIPKDRIILIGSPPVDEEAWAEERKKKDSVSTKCNILAGVYSDAAAQVGVDTGVKFIDLYHGMMEDKEWKGYLNDGLHFSARGSDFLFSKLWPVIEELTANLPILQPSHDEVAAADNVEELLMR